MNAHPIPTMERLKHIVNTMQDRPVLVVGDIMLDRFVYGQVDRISPESPVPVLSIKRENKMLGGAGNALASLKGLKTKADIISVIGDDAEGQIIRDELSALNVDPDCLISDPARPTTIKTRFLAGHQQLLRTDYEDKKPISGDVEEKILKKAGSLIHNAKAVLISDYGKGLLTQTVIRALIDLAKKQDIPVIVDPKGLDFSIYSGATAITPNKKELSEATQNSAVDTDQQVVKAASRLIEACNLQAVIATRSKDGMSIIEKDRTGTPLHLRTTALDVFDVSGAGDVVIATITAAMAAGASLAEAGALANIAGGIAVSKVGTTPIRARELTDSLTHEDTETLLRSASYGQSRIERERSAPVLDFEEAKEQVNRWKARGLQIGFTNGCFDILHLGHVSYLNEARNHCDRLVIGLNTDASVKALKGEDRPVHHEESRAAVLSALGSVDMVVLFGGKGEQDDQTANALIACLHPDIYFKGGDYHEDDVPETPIVKKYGGRVKILSAFEGHSTSAAIDRIKNKAA